MHVFRLIAVTALALGFATLALSPSEARGRHGGKGTQTGAATPANASAAVCRTRARDYAYEKHADPGQERMFFDKCLGH